MESDVLYEVIIPEYTNERVRHPNIGKASRQAQKEWRRGTLFWNSYEKGTYVKKYAEHSDGQVSNITYTSRSTSPGRIL